MAQWCVMALLAASLVLPQATFASSASAVAGLAIHPGWCELEHRVAAASAAKASTGESLVARKYRRVD
jgi:hypothetical protein